MKINNNISQDILKRLHSTMLLIRRTEERIADILSTQDSENKEIKTPCHLYIGQEAVATGVCLALKRQDYVFGTHRSHGYYIAKGGDLNLMMAEIYGRTTGCSKGKGGSMHLCAPKIGLLGTSAIVAGVIPIAVGTALASSIRKDSRASVAFFGDGATNEGVFYESLNFASLHKLPVIFVCENNLYSTHMPIIECSSGIKIYKKAKEHNMLGIRIDGNDVIKIYQKIKKLLSCVRRNKGPVLIEAMTYRWRGHVGPNYDIGKGLRPRKELDVWIEKCPIKKLENFLFKNKLLTDAGKKKLIKNIDRQIGQAFEFAKKSPYPNKKDLLKKIYA